ncbi:putative ATP-dependent RNA helicase DDX20 [Amphibalanus amphitrite]|uniref:RNA helicase n=1 Tax=Amphibalanus amphitrite TaxID=1232801 RepID=A0A6A4WRJ1_AMPAM|nr:putative ATP-dependent RNA helicase DDX20 [Amphibalanus amphitrite]KAF0307930.1 putative ATP-dependent RNA helicase DDX20 [Amphibalanus amphitrite]
MSRPAHRLAAKPRTSDVAVSEDVTFAGLLLSEPVLLGLRRAGFERPSPIQLRAIPLGRCAVDLIVQAKSGTGKTCVLAVLALEALVAAPPSGRCRALVLAPTREVAVQVAQVITAIGVEVPGLAVQTLIGGLPLAQDVANLRRCNVAVGTPGRIRQLVDCEALNTDSVRLFVMDEADKLMEDAFVDDINFIYSTLPASKQMIALSATYPDTLASLLARYMRSPTFVRLGKSSPALLGIRQYVMTVPCEPLVTKQLKVKLEALVNILSTVSFTQCLVFSNHQTRAETLCSQLSSRGWPSAHLSSSLSQERRLEALSQLTSLRCRVLVTTDLGARGVDSEHADLVVQLDVPWDGATYLHRVGRAGRYGSLGAAVALVSLGEEEQRLTTVIAAAGVSPLRLPQSLPDDIKTCDTTGCSSTATRLVVNYDEEVRQIPNQEEDVEAFQRDLRMGAARKKAFLASRVKDAQRKSVRGRAFPAGKDSSSGEDSNWGPYGGSTLPPHSWDELLNVCYDQQTRYLSHMTSYYTQYYGLSQS